MAERAEDGWLLTPKSQPDLPLSAQLTSLLCTGYAQAPVQTYFPEEGTEQVLNNCCSLFMDGKSYCGRLL